MKRAGGSVIKGRHERWLKEYEAWVTSGQEQRLFCESRGYLTGTFKSRIKRLREVGLIERRVGRKVPADSVRVGFARVHLEGSANLASDRSTEPYCEIRFRDSGRLVIEEAVGIERFRELLLGMVR